MDYRLVFTRLQDKAGGHLLIKAIERGRLTISGNRSLNTNPYLLRLFKKRFNRAVL